MTTRWVYPSVLLVSTAAIAYEILLMRVLSIVHWHHFAYMIISLALLGYGASGTFIAIARDALARHFALAFSLSALAFAVTMIGSYIVGQVVPFNALEIVWDPAQFLHLGAMYLVFFVPFFFAATCIGLAFTCGREHISRIYFFDLLGAGVGALGIVLALFLLWPQDVLRLLVCVALLAAALAVFTLPVRYGLGSVYLLLAVTVLVGLPQSWLDLRMSPYKGLQQTLEVMGTRVLHEESSPLGLLTVVESPAIPFRHAPGLSFSTRFEPPEQLAIFTDGDAMSTMTRYDGSDAKLGYMDDVTQALPFRLLENPRVLVLGAGGGTDVLFALHHGARRVDAVEMDPLAVALAAEEYGNFTGHLYDDDRVVVHVAEARGFVRRSEDRFDLIHVALMDSFAASGAGVQALGESYLYTVEAIQEYLHRLEPGGLLAITRWIKLPPRDNLKLVATVRAALERDGINSPASRVAIIRSWNTATLLVKNGDISAAESDLIRDFAASRSFDVAWYPGMTRSEANRFNVLPAPYLHDGTVSLLGDDRNAFIERYKFDITPATDDRPYFFHFFKWSAFEEMMSLREQGGAGLIEWGYLVLAGTLLQAAVAGAVLILMPLSVVRPSWHRGTGRRMGSYFLLLGLAFLFVEMAFIQKFILFLSHPLYSVAVVLTGFLLFAGIGSACSPYVARLAAARNVSPLTLVVAAIVAIGLAYLLLLPLVFEHLAGLPDLQRIVISLSLIAPLAFVMGMPFPLGLAWIAGSAPAFIPWAWGINGYASVVSASMATLLAIEFGFGAVVVLAMLLYALAALVYPAGDSQNGSQRAYPVSST